MRKTLCLLLVLVVALPAVVAADFYKGMAAYKRGDFEAAKSEWLPIAEEGDPEAQYRLGQMYYQGKIEPNDAEALRWYRAAAEAGHSMAQNNLGLMYDEGRGGEAGPSEATFWYGKAAAQNLATAQYNLAHAYETGRGIPADGAQARRWYRLAAEQGHLNSQVRLARMYEEGDGVPQDAKLAAKWYREAAIQGDGPSQSALASMYDEGRGVERNPKKAEKWHGRASAQGLFPTLPPSPAGEPAEPADAAPPALAVLPPPAVASTPAVPEGVPVRAQAPRDLAQDGDAESLYLLAQMYNTGQGVARSLAEAGRWYREAAELGHEMAGYRLAFLYLKGQVNANRDYVEAHKWFSLSALRGVGDAGDWRDKIAKKMTAEELELSARLVREWQPRGPKGVETR